MTPAGWTVTRSRGRALFRNWWLHGNCSGLGGGEAGPLNVGNVLAILPGLKADQMPEFNDMKTWREHLGHTRLRSFTDGQGHLWLEQNAEKRSKWARLAREGHDVAWEFESPGGSYTGRMLIDGEIYTPSEATKKFLQESP
jgi:hypothetical protein